MNNHLFHRMIFLLEFMHFLVFSHNYQLVIHRRLLNTVTVISGNFATVRSTRIVILVKLNALILTHSLLRLVLF